MLRLFYAPPSLGTSQEMLKNFHNLCSGFGVLASSRRGIPVLCSPVLVTYTIRYPIEYCTVPESPGLERKLLS